MRTLTKSQLHSLMGKPAARGASAVGAQAGGLEARVRAWNAQPDHVRTRRIGVAKGLPFNSFTARARLPFTLPAGATLYEDGSIRLRRGR